MWGRNFTDTFFEGRFWVGLGKGIGDNVGVPERKPNYKVFNIDNTPYNYHTIVYRCLGRKGRCGAGHVRKKSRILV